MQLSKSSHDLVVVMLFEFFQEIDGNNDDDMDYLYEVEKDLGGEGEIVRVTKVWNKVDSEFIALRRFHSKLW